MTQRNIRRLNKIRILTRKILKDENYMIEDQQMINSYLVALERGLEKGERRRDWTNSTKA